MIQFEYVNPSAIDIDVRIVDTTVSLEIIESLKDSLDTLLNSLVNYNILVQLNSRISSVLNDYICLGSVIKYETYILNNHLITIYKQSLSSENECIIVNLPMETKYKIRDLQFRFPESSFCKLLVNSPEFGPISYFDNSIQSLVYYSL